MDTYIRRISNLSKPREAEGAGSRYALLRQQPYGSWEKKRHKRDFSGDDFGDDQANVSTKALLLFLENFLSRRFGDNIDQEHDKKDSYDNKDRLLQPKAKIEALRSKAAQAARAYAHAAHVSDMLAVNNSNMPPSSPQQSENRAILRTGDTGDVQLVINLIAELHFLDSKNIHTLKIERGENFLDSLKDAIASAKSKLEI